MDVKNQRNYQMACTHYNQRAADIPWSVLCIASCTCLLLVLFVVFVANCMRICVYAIYFERCCTLRCPLYIAMQLSIARTCVVLHLICPVAAVTNAARHIMQPSMM